MEVPYETRPPSHPSQVVVTLRLHRANPRANHFFTLVGVPFYGVRFTARLAWDVATAGILKRTNFRPTPTRAAGDDLPF